MTKTEALEQVEFWFAEVDNEFYGALNIAARPGKDGPQVVLEFKRTEQ